MIGGSRTLSLAVGLVLSHGVPVRPASFVPHPRVLPRAARPASSPSAADGAGDAFRGVDTLLFDLDGTLYSGDNGTKGYMQARIFQYMVERTAADSFGDAKFDAITTIEEARAVWEPQFKKYNQSLRGLVAAGYKIDQERWNAFFREGMEDLLEEDPALRAVLASLPQRKVIFTNAPEASARRCLEALGVSDLFPEVYGAETMGPSLCKPERAAFDAVLARMGVAPDDAPARARIAFVEDSVANLRAGAALGLRTVLVECSTAREEGEGDAEALRREFGVVVRDLGADLRGAAPGLWE